jgi:nicotinate phosphoribosyltransferase
MAHSLIQAFDDEVIAFESFARSRPDNLVLLIDTYDSEAAAVKVVELASRLKGEGIRVRGVRLDSGDLVTLSRSVRSILDDGGLADVTIFASGGIDEDALAALTEQGAPIDGFGIGTSLVTSSDAPALDCAYKLQEYAGLPRRKRSTGKETWPGRKQVWRRYGPDGKMTGDILSVEDDVQPGEPLIRAAVQGGRRIGQAPTMTEMRAHAAQQLAALPEPLSRLRPEADYPVETADALVRLAGEVDRRLARHHATR